MHPFLITVLSKSIWVAGWQWILGGLGTRKSSWVPKWRFQGFSRGTFHRGCYVVWSEYTQDWEQCRRNVPGVPGHHTVRTFHRSKPLNMHSMSFKTGKRICFTIFFDGAYFLLAVMVEGDESSRRFWSATGPYVVFYYVFHEYAKYTCV